MVRSVRPETPAKAPDSMETVPSGTDASGPASEGHCSRLLPSRSIRKPSLEEKTWFESDTEKLRNRMPANAAGSRSVMALPICRVSQDRILWPPEESGRLTVGSKAPAPTAVRPSGRTGTDASGLPAKAWLPTDRRESGRASSVREQQRKASSPMVCSPPFHVIWHREAVFSKAPRPMVSSVEGRTRLRSS